MRSQVLLDNISSGDSTVNSPDGKSLDKGGKAKEPKDREAYTYNKKRNKKFLKSTMEKYL